jgi:hypothetical protein
MKGNHIGEHRTKNLGLLSEHTVFESEVAGAILALDIVSSLLRLTEVDIFRLPTSHHRPLLQP